MPQELRTKHAVCFIDGQNLFRHAKAAFGHYHPNYDPIKLSEAVCERSGWLCTGTRFYTGVPIPEHDERWHGYWHRRLTAMRRGGVHVTSRKLRYTREEVTHPDGSTEEILVPREKGIDLRLGLDVVRMARGGQIDVAVIFSQDQDLAELAREIRDIARSTGRWLKIASAYPDSLSARPRKGIDSTDWLPIDQTLYDACLDPRDYRPANW